MLLAILLAVLAFLFACWLTPRRALPLRKTPRPSRSPLFPAPRWRGEQQGFVHGGWLARGRV
jgi:hypothetical protein